MPLIVKPHDLVNDTTADADHVDANFEELYDLVNGLLDNANLAAAANIAGSKLADNSIAAAKLMAPPIVSVTRNSGNTIGHATVTKQVWNDQLHDTDNMFRGAPNDSKLYATTAGIYRVSTVIEWSPDDTGTRLIRFVKNNVSIHGTNAVGPGGSTDVTAQCLTRLIRMNAEDYLEVEVYQQRIPIATLDLTTNCFFEMERVGPL